VALIDDFKARFPEFSTAQVDQYLPILEPVWPCYFNRPYLACNQEAILNLVAHLMAGEIAAASSSAVDQQVASQSVGSVSVSYVQGQQTGGDLTQWLKTTRYGQRFLLLTRRFGGGVAV